MEKRRKQEETKSIDFINKKKIVRQYSVLEGSMCEAALQNHSYYVDETIGFAFTYVNYNSICKINVRQNLANHSRVSNTFEKHKGAQQ